MINNVMTAEKATFQAEGSVEQFVISVPQIAPTVLGQDVKKIFENTLSIEGVVVIDGGRPVGIIMRTAFFQKISTMHGHSLFMKRPIDLVMDRNMMTIDTSENISQIGIRAMNREQTKLYDYILVKKDGKYIGVISIRLFLIDLANRNAAQIKVLEEQQRELIAANEKEMMLSRDLEQKSASVRNLFDNADQGFLSFEEDMIIKSEFSYKCIEIFGQKVGGKNFIELMALYFSEDRKDVFGASLDSYFKNNSPITDNVFLMLLPSECVIDNKHIHIAYRRIENGGKKAVMVILSDVSEKIKMEQVLERDRAQQRFILKVISCQSQIKQMMDEFRELFTEGYSSYFDKTDDIRDGLNELFRAVHTFKGDFAQYGFIYSPEKLHVFEDRLCELVQRTGEVRLDEIEAVMGDIDPDKVLSEDLSVIEEILGASYFGGSELLSIPKSKIEKAAEAIKGCGDMLEAETAVNIINSLKLKPLKDCLEQYRDYVQYLADKLLKTMPVYIVEGDDIEIFPEDYSGFTKSLVHIYRNIMDHGIEPDEERLEAEKPQCGVIKCVTTLNENTFTLSISDDGKGIDLNKLRMAAVDKGRVSREEADKMSDEEAANLIFMDSMSTKDTASSISGRGVGMAAFMHETEKIGGTISLNTKRGKGTEFIIEFPL